MADDRLQYELGDCVHLAGEETGQLTIQVLSRAPDQDYWDGNWLACSIVIEAGGVRGCFNANLRTDELDSFYKLLC